MAESVRPGIYQIHNRFTGMRYVGQSGRVRRRLATHRLKLTRGAHGNDHLQASWNRHGPEVFAFEFLAVIEPALLTVFEQRAFDVMHHKYGCYNHGPFLDNAMRGKKLLPFPEERRQNMGAAHTGIKRLPFSVEWRRNMSAAQKRRAPASAETRRKIGNAHRGKMVSEETRRKLSEAGRGRKHGPCSEERRGKLRKASRLRHRDSITGRYLHRDS